MANQFVDNVWLWGVLWVAVMPYVLGGVEDLKGQGVQKLALRQKTTYGFQPPAGLALNVL